MGVNTVFIGWDSREVEAYEVADFSLKRHATCELRTVPLKLDELTLHDIMWRPVERRDVGLWDVVSNAPQSTEFALSRFVVGHLQPSGWCLFVDCDVLFMDDVADLFALADDKYAVMCVQHDYTPKSATKMDAQANLRYRRKNWSSLMLWNCDHPANRRLTLDIINTWPGLLLHQFSWLRDSEIGALPPRWNWLVGEQAKPDNPALAHFTRGGPFLQGWKISNDNHDKLWLDEHDLLRRTSPVAPGDPAGDHAAGI